MATDNELVVLIKSALDEQLATWEWAASPGTVVVQQKEQPVKQGVPTGPTIFIEKLFDTVYGSPRAYYDASASLNMLTEKEEQVYATHYQISALVVQRPNGSLLLPTASDLATAARFMLQRRVAIRKFSAAGVGLLRVTAVQNPYFTDDRDRQEGAPSFGLVVTHVRSVNATVDKIVSVDSTIVQVP